MTPLTFSQGVEASLAPWADKNGAWVALNAALASMFETPWGIVAPQGSPDDPANYTAGWSTLLDPNNCPTQFLAYPSMFNGTGVPPGTDDSDARMIIKAESGFARGTLGSIQSAIERAQTSPDPTRYAIQERIGLGGPDPYHFLVNVDLNSLVTQGDPTQLTANVSAVKPAGLQFTVVPFNAPLLSQYTRLLSAVTVPLSAAQLSDVT